MRGCIVSADLSVLNLVIVRKGAQLAGPNPVMLLHYFRLLLSSSDVASHRQRQIMHYLGTWHSMQQS